MAQEEEVGMGPCTGQAQEDATPMATGAPDGEPLDTPVATVAQEGEAATPELLDTMAAFRRKGVSSSFLTVTWTTQSWSPVGLSLTPLTLWPKATPKAPEVAER